MQVALGHWILHTAQLPNSLLTDSPPSTFFTNVDKWTGYYVWFRETSGLDLGESVFVYQAKMSYAYRWQWDIYWIKQSMVDQASKNYVALNVLLKKRLQYQNTRL